ncbi:uncharacterized protein LOC110443391 isoform X1 [Mizuhopecten yessoensis]|uniref:uncharacterized protein LOC110443391 isoform X1 n=1 Tax=Mizuhopecten yessoensis TaxID=6573 RepID=UPI000B457432|nr:uncharacterized protein LOC110443391 isoform X1 [Mizuhopecten yessoensis]
MGKKDTQANRGAQVDMYRKQIGKQDYKKSKNEVKKSKDRAGKIQSAMGIKGNVQELGSDVTVIVVQVNVKEFSSEETVIVILRQMSRYQVEQYGTIPTTLDMTRLQRQQYLVNKHIKCVVGMAGIHYLL